MILFIGISFCILVLVLLYAVSTHNRLVALRNRYRNAYAQIDVQLKRRYELIPNLVETARGYLKHEHSTLEEVMAARSAAESANATAAANPGALIAMQTLTGAEKTLNASLGKLLARVEAYPDLKANEEMLQLMEDLTSTENRVAFARQAYNDMVMIYNTAREVFPANCVAGYCHFDAAELFAIENAQEKNVPSVSLS